MRPLGLRAADALGLDDGPAAFLLHVLDRRLDLTADPVAAALVRRLGGGEVGLFLEVKVLLPLALGFDQLRPVEAELGLRPRPQLLDLALGDGQFAGQSALRPRFLLGPFGGQAQQGVQRVAPAERVDRHRGGRP